MFWPVVNKNRVDPPDHERRRCSTRLMARITPQPKLIPLAPVCVKSAVILSMLYSGRVKGR